jgi:hypothetical protein
LGEVCAILACHTSNQTAYHVTSFHFNAQRS